MTGFKAAPSIVVVCPGSHTFEMPEGAHLEGVGTLKRAGSPVNWPIIIPAWPLYLHVIFPTSPPSSQCMKETASRHFPEHVRSRSPARVISLVQINSILHRSALLIRRHAYPGELCLRFRLPAGSLRYAHGLAASASAREHGSKWESTGPRSC